MRVELRGWQVGDLPVVEEAAGDPYIPMITSVPAVYTPAEGLAWLRRQWEKTAQGQAYPKAVVARATGEVVGFATVDGVDLEHRRAAVGYWILPRYRGQGYATEALALLPEVARELGIIRLEAVVEPDNTASLAACRAVGFVEEGTLRAYCRFGDRQRDMVMLGMVLG